MRIKINNIIDILPRHPTKKYKLRDSTNCKRIVVHCSGMDEKASGTLSTIKALAKYDISPGNHISSSGCPAVTYHYMIGTKGDIYATLPVEEISWHVGPWNDTSIGICLLYDPKDTINVAGELPSQDMLTSAIKLCAAIALKLNLTPDDVVGHRELKNTGWFFFKGSKKLRKTCPGLTVSLDSFRKKVSICMQKTLKVLGYYNDPIDGRFDSSSITAMKLMADNFKKGEPDNVFCP